MDESRELLSSLSFCVIDLETTGGNQENDQIIEVGMVNIDNLTINDSKNYLVNPEKEIPEFIQKLTSIKQKDVADKPTIENLIDDIIDFIGDRIIVAHNTSFDVPFLNSVLKRLGKDPLTNKVICTNVMTKHMIPEIMTSNLNYMSQLFDIDHEKAHRAMDDATAAAKLLLKYLEIFEKKGIKKVNQLYYPRNKFELDRVHFQKEDSIDTILNTIKVHQKEMLITIKGNRGIILGVVPIQSPKDELEFIKECLEETDWEIITISLMSPFIEGLFQFNNHFLKYPENVREKIKNYLENKFKTNKKANISLEDLDFLVGHHLVSGQICVYSFLNLNTNKKNIFKIPSHKKKMMHFLTHQIKTFEKNQKGKKRSLLHPELVSLIEGYLTLQQNESNYFLISRKEIKSEQTQVFKNIEKFVNGRKDRYFFPRNHF